MEVHLVRPIGPLLAQYSVGEAGDGRSLAGRRRVEQGQEHDGVVGDGRRLREAAGVEDEVAVAFHEVIAVVPQGGFD